MKETTWKLFQPFEGQDKDTSFEVAASNGNGMSWKNLRHDPNADKTMFVENQLGFQTKQNKKCPKHLNW